jgi:LmbE family N-acetylglucosaminyl deacetylase
MPRTILAVSAHADDADYLAGGYIHQRVEAGDTVYYLVLTDSSKGVEDASLPAAEIARLRAAEQVAAAQVHGVAGVFFGHFTDGELKNNKALRRVITRYIRRLKPDLVLSWNPGFWYSVEHQWANHPDHRVAGEATLDAVSLFARNAASFPKLLAEGLTPHIVPEIWFFSLTDEYTFVEDISGAMDYKLKAMAAHVTQTDGSDEAMVIRWGAEIGWRYGYQYGEAFTCLTIGH